MVVRAAREIVIEAPRIKERFGTPVDRITRPVDSHEWFMNAIPWRWTIDTATGQVKNQATSHVAGEFPAINPNKVGIEHKFGYFATTRGRDADTMSDGSWQGGTNANGIFVRSQDDAFAGLVKITGTDGASELEMVVDSLLVHADAARERGRVLLARAGKIKTETRTLPLFPAPADPGLIPLGSLLEIEDTDETDRKSVV